jgi:Fic-DOC domain mobile mystery protein B
MKELENPNFGNTSLSLEELDGLKLSHITTYAELNRWEQENIQEALIWLEKQKKANLLTEEFICELHKRMFGKVWKWAGKFRRSEKNIGVTWITIPQQLKMLLEDIRFWVENKTYEPDEIAYRAHHRLVAIHLFPNGNGRHARLFADLILTNVFQIPAFSWGNGNLTEASLLRTKYIQALRCADRHDYWELEKFVSS